VILMIHVDFLI